MPNNHELAWRLQRQIIAERRPGWTMEYIDTLDALEIIDIFAVIDGKNRAIEFMNGSK